jgi:hypothetical protein
MAGVKFKKRVENPFGAAGRGKAPAAGPFLAGSGPRGAACGAAPKAPSDWEWGR